MNIEDYEFSKQTADNLEYILIHSDKDAENLYTSAKNILVGFKEAFEAQGRFDENNPVTNMMKELEDDPDRAIEIIFRLARNIRMISLDRIYEEIVLPVIKPESKA